MRPTDCNEFAIQFSLARAAAVLSRGRSLHSKPDRNGDSAKANNMRRAGSWSPPLLAIGWYWPQSPCRSRLPLSHLVGRSHPAPRASSRRHARLTTSAMGSAVSGQRRSVSNRRSRVGPVAVGRFRRFLDRRHTLVAMQPLSSPSTGTDLHADASCRSNNSGQAAVSLIDAAIRLGMARLTQRALESLGVAY